MLSCDLYLANGTITIDVQSVGDMRYVENGDKLDAILASATTAVTQTTIPRLNTELKGAQASGGERTHYSTGVSVKIGGNEVTVSWTVVLWHKDKHELVSSALAESIEAARASALRQLLPEKSPWEATRGAFDDLQRYEAALPAIVTDAGGMLPALRGYENEHNRADPARRLPDVLDVSAYDTSRFDPHKTWLYHLRTRAEDEQPPMHRP